MEAKKSLSEEQMNVLVDDVIADIVEGDDVGMLITLSAVPKQQHKNLIVKLATSLDELVQKRMATQN